MPRRLHLPLFVSLSLLASCGRGGAKEAGGADSSAVVADTMPPATDDSELAAAIDTTEFGVYVLAYDSMKPAKPWWEPGPRIGASAATEDTRFPTLDGVLSIEREGPENGPGLYRVRVDGRLVLEDSSSYFVGVRAYTEHVHGMGHVFVIETHDGGTGCPALFHVVEMSSHFAYVTSDFGSCSSYFELQTDSGEVRMTFPDYYTLWQAESPGFVEQPPITWVYRGQGRIEMLKERRRRTERRG
jgi:hypothetical protein